MKSIPQGWKYGLLSDFVVKLDAGVSVNAEDVASSNGQAGVLKISCVSRGIFNPKENKTILPQEVFKAKVNPQKNCIIISRSNTQALVGASAYIPEDHPILFLPDTLWQTVYREGVLFSPRWLSYWLQAPSTRKRLGSIAAGTSGSMKKLSKPVLLSIEVLIPSFKEQEKIAEILRSLDSAIQSVESLVSAKTKLKTGLMQQLLTGKRRFREFTTQKWQLMSVSDFTTQAVRVRPKPDKAFLALGIRSHGKGTFHKPDFDPAKIEMTELYEVKENDLIVNITFAWEGAIAVAKGSDTGALVSHRFPTYEFDRELAIPEYFRYVIVQKWFVEKLGLISPGGAGRNRVLSKRDFVKIEVLMPSVEEQRRIADVLNACDKEIELLKRQLDALKRQKRGLMQKLLTGQIRVKVDDIEATAVEAGQ